MNVNTNNTFLSSSADDRAFFNRQTPKGSVQTESVKLQNMSEKANLTFDNLSFGMSQQEKDKVAESLNSIGKAAAFAAINGYDSQDERLVVTQYFGNFSGVISDDAIKKMIASKLNNPNYENREFLENFSQQLDEPLRSINITV